MQKNYHKLNDEEIVKQSLDNNPKAIKELLLRVQKSSEKYLHNMNPYFYAKFDLIQEILLKVIKNIKYLKNPKNLNKWSKKIISNTYYDYIKKQKRINQNLIYGLITSEDKIPMPEDENQRPYKKVYNKDLKEKIQKAIMKLQKSHRLIVLLRDYEGFSYQKIADLLKLNTGTVKSRLARARNKLQKELRNYL